MSYLINPYILGEQNPISDVYASYTGSSFSGTTWFDTSGNARNASVTAGSVTVISTTGNGTSKTFTALQGNTATKIAFPASVLPSTYTLFHITRYIGTTTARIITSNDANNWLSGHWGGLSGISYHNNWMTQSVNSHHYNKWVLSTDQNSLYRSNMVTRSYASPGSPSYCNLGINTYAAEQSAWECAEIIVYNRTLSESEYLQVEEYLDRKYGLGLTTSTLPIPNLGLSVYLDASNTLSYPGSGTAWNDLSENQYNFTWSTTPTFTNAGQLSYFSTTGKQAVGLASNAMGMAMASGYTIIYIAQTNSLTTNAAFKYYLNTGTSSASRAIFVHPTWSASPANLYFDQNGCCNADQRLNVDVNAFYSAPRMWTVRRALNGNRSIIRGNTSMASTTTAPSSGTLGNTAMKINDNDDSYNWDARLYAFIAYNRGLSDTEINSIYTYFSGRGISN